ncbi:unnamed protein product [Symbiodinium microadriaticum]|nr:unnamed protein product [Symbiodinium microadriaticum]
MAQQLEGHQKISDLVTQVLMHALGPLFSDFASGPSSTPERALQLTSKAKNHFGVLAGMHLNCTNKSSEMTGNALLKCKQRGVHGHPLGTAGGFSSALDLLKFIRQNHDDYFSVSVVDSDAKFMVRFSDVGKTVLAMIYAGRPMRCLGRLLAHPRLRGGGPPGSRGRDTARPTRSSASPRSLREWPLSEWQKQSLRKLDLKRQALPEDGDCFFHALALHSELSPSALRARVALEVESNAEFLRLFPDRQALRSHVSGIRTGEWADHISVQDRGPRRPEGDHRRLGSCRHRDLRHSPPGDALRRSLPRIPRHCAMQRWGQGWRRS